MKIEKQLLESGDRACTARLDRIRIVAGIQRKGKLPALQGFRIVRDSFVAQQTSTRTYLRCRQLICDETGTRVFWQYAAQRRWLKSWRITVIGNDRVGLRRPELDRITSLCPQHTVILAEIAFDFRAASGIDQNFVRRHGLFGKSRPFSKRGGPGQLRYGTRNSGKLVRAYLKPATDSYRVELEFHSKILRQKLVNQVADLPRLRAAAWPAHVNFVAIRWGALRRCLDRRNAGASLLKRAQRQSESIHELMTFLRRTGLNNPRRFLMPSAKNLLVRNAAERWAERFGGVADEK